LALSDAVDVSLDEHLVIWMDIRHHASLPGGRDVDS